MTEDDKKSMSTKSYIFTSYNRKKGRKNIPQNHSNQRSKWLRWELQGRTNHKQFDVSESDMLKKQSDPTTG